MFLLHYPWASKPLKSHVNFSRTYYTRPDFPVTCFQKLALSGCSDFPLPFGSDYLNYLEPV